MLKSFLALSLLLALVPAPGARAADPVPAHSPRVTALYSTWDEYYVYLGAQVQDAHVNSVNTTPISQPQQDDDIEVFFETDGARASVRTKSTYQMAVSAANGAYFSVGTGGKVPKAKAVFTYKYAAAVDGTLNNNSDTDTGYTIEIAIPWQELGLSKPPKSGTEWGFNVISRDRDSTGKPAARFYSLSPDVRAAADVQNPSKWTRIVFDNGGGAEETPGRVVCPHVALDRFPLINGSIVSGEWPSSSRLAFGAEPISAPAPTLASEPNTTQSPFDIGPPDLPAAPPAQEASPASNNGGAVSAPALPPVATAPSGAIDLPGGGSIKIIPGGSAIKPEGPPTVAAALPPPSDIAPGAYVNPLTPKFPKGYKPSEAGVSLTGSLKLGPNKPSPLVVAVYRLDYNGDARKAPAQNVWNARGGSLLADQPINGAGPWFSGLRPLWHRQQLADLRRAGIEIALLRCRADDPLLGREADALVEALKEMKAANQDYPLVGIDPAHADAGAIALARVPAEFRAPALPDGVQTVSPGRIEGGKLVARSGGQTYAQRWQNVSDAPAVVVDSWNDFTNGTEIAASRQYGEKYADDTRLLVNAFNGNREWHAKYLQEWVPRTVRPRTLYQVPLRIENAGTLPWRAGEGYALCPRWYKDGRLYDDSAPRIPIGKDVLPGQSITLSVGLVALNGYGDDLEPGDYTLVFDMVQGNDHWFSYADDNPLQVAVKVVPFAQTLPSQATFLSAQTPVSGRSGGVYQTLVQVRNDGSAHWNRVALAYKVQKVDADTGDVRTITEGAMPPLGADPAMPGPVLPGQVANIGGALTLSNADGKPLPSGEYRIHWYIKPSKGEAIDGSYDEPLRVVGTDPGASFILSDIPRAMGAGKEETAKLAVQNLGVDKWPKMQVHIGYHWYSLDGTEAAWDGGTLTPLTHDVLPGGVDGGLNARFRAPNLPGRYALVWDVQMGDGAWASTSQASEGTDILPVLVNVGGKGDAVPVDLSRYADAVGIVSEGTAVPAGGGFDGAGHAFPAVMTPPDGTSEVDGNPLLLGKPGPPLYPSGYYSQQTGADDASNHRVSFLYPKADAPDVVTCRGQTLDLPGGNYRAVHLLAASVGGVSAAFSVPGQDGPPPSPWRIGRQRPPAQAQASAFAARIVWEGRGRRPSPSRWATTR